MCCTQAGTAKRGENTKNAKSRRHEKRYICKTLACKGRTELLDQKNDTIEGTRDSGAAGHSPRKFN